MSMPAELEPLRRNWGLLLACGIVLIVLGLIALSSPVMVTLATVEIFGWLLLLSAVADVVHIFWARRWGGAILDVLSAVLCLIVGLLIVTHPVQSSIELTWILAVFLMVGGLFRLVGSAMLQFPRWQWAALSGFISLALGVMVWRQLPATGLWFIGICVGVDLLFYGWSWVMFALLLRDQPQPVV